MKTEESIIACFTFSMRNVHFLFTANKKEGPEAGLEDTAATHQLQFVYLCTDIITGLLNTASTHFYLWLSKPDQLVFWLNVTNICGGEKIHNPKIYYWLKIRAVCCSVHVVMESLVSMCNNNHQMISSKKIKELVVKNLIILNIHTSMEEN